MSDQCNSCAHKGDIKNCLKTDCSFHDLWIVNYFKSALKEISEIAKSPYGSTLSLLGRVANKCDEVLNEDNQG